MLPTWLPTPRLPSHRWGSEKYYHIGGKRQEIKKELECQKIFESKKTVLSWLEGSHVLSLSITGASGGSNRIIIG